MSNKKYWMCVVCVSLYPYLDQMGFPAFCYGTLVHSKQLIVVEGSKTSESLSQLHPMSA